MAQQIFRMTQTAMLYADCAILAMTSASQGQLISPLSLHTGDK